MTPTTTQQIALKISRTTPRLWGSAAVFAALLLALYAALPALGVTFSPASNVAEVLYRPSAALLNAVDVTSVLVIVAVLAVVTVVRGLPYGIGAVLLLSLGATIGTAIGRSLVGTYVTPSALPDARLVAVTAIVAAASLTLPARVVPAVVGLGAAVVVAVSGAALVTASASIVGVVGSLAVVGFWWSVAAVIMAHSPIAAAREAKNPMNTAALMLRRD